MKIMRMKHLLQLFLGKNFRVNISNDTFLTIKIIKKGVIGKRFLDFLMAFGG